MASTGTITSTGLGSGLDVESLVTKLMSVEKAPITLLQTKESSYQTKLTAWGSIKSALSSLEDSADALRTYSSVLSYSASVASSSVASASANSTATSGSYSLEVTQLARAQKIESAAHTSSSDTIATGTLTIASGSSSVDVTIDSTNNTLAGVAKAINAANAGVTASVANDGSNYYLVFTGNNTGSSNTFSMSGISELTYDSTDTSSSPMSTIYSAQDAKLSVDGIAYTRSSNTVSDVISGVTLSLSGLNSGNATTVNVTPSASDLQTKINTFITDYNAVINLISTDTAYDSTNQTAGDLNGDSTAASIKAQLRSVVSSTFSAGSLTRLSSIGMKIAVDGTLSISNQSTLTSALSTTPTEVAKLFSGYGATNGIADNIYSKISSYLGVTGAVTDRISAINTSITNTASKITTLNARMSIIEATYRSKFTALDTLISSLNSTSSYLTTALNSLNSK
jgi:flagellar hook-associated protein 2